MKVFIPLLCLLSAALAEPPVDSYASARSHDHSHHQHSKDLQRTPSQEYGPPGFGARNSPSTQYGPPSRTASRSSLSDSYGLPSSKSTPSDTYGVPASRLSQEYGPPSARSDFGSPSTQYGPPALRSGLSQEYGVPTSRSSHSLSEQYGPPSSRSLSARNGLSQEYGVPSGRTAKNGKSSHKGKSSKGRFHSTNHGVSFARNSDSYSQDAKSYSANQRDLSETYGVPAVRGLSQEYGVPSSNGFQNNDGVISARSSLSDTYGVPSARSSMPSEEYGVPEQEAGGYGLSRAALEELLNQEPANYEFAYKVDDLESGSDFGHTEEREGDKATGTYFVVLPDGTKQIVEYEADEHGFRPRISVEAADLSRSGYDDNAADLARSGDGPY